MQLSKIMQKELITVTPDASLRDAAVKMQMNDVGCILITRGDHLEGVLTDRDLVISAIAKGEDPQKMKVSEIMNTRVITATPSMDVEEAARLMGQNKIRRLPVTEDGKVKGIVTISDISHVFRQEMDYFFSVEEAPCHTH